MIFYHRQIDFPYQKWFIIRAVAIILANSEFIPAFFLKLKIHKAEVANFSLFYILIMNWKVKNDFRNFQQILRFWDPLSQNKQFLRKCLSVCL